MIKHHKLDEKMITFEIEAITPIFIAGADQKYIKNEGLRPPSMRGLLRWWFRAIMGGMVPTEKLGKLESGIFGSTNYKSPLTIISSPDPRTLQSEINIPFGLGYLWFSIGIQKSRGQRTECYPPKSKFEVVLKSDDEESLKLASGCFWTMVHLGGVGSRMRRGGGSLKIIRADGAQSYDFVFNGKTVEEAKNFLEENLRKIFNDFRKYAGGDYDPPASPEFAVLSRNHASIGLLKQTFSTWQGALKNIGDKYSRYRRGMSLINKCAFGLPLVQWREFRELRHASPLLIGIIDLGDQVAVRLVKFYTSIHPQFRRRTNLDVLRKFDSEIEEIAVEIPE